MNLNDFYVLVDLEKQQIIDKIQKLPENWKNIAGLTGLSNLELENLNWAGHHNLGWINIKSENIKNFYYSPENLELNKNELKVIISNIRKNKQTEPIRYKNAIIKVNIESRYSLQIIKEMDEVNYKCINGYYTFTSFDIKEICAIIDGQIQKYFDIEKNIYEQINNCSSISDFLNINYDF
jgi:hypothetical protein